MIKLFKTPFTSIAITTLWVLLLAMMIWTISIVQLLTP